MILGTIQRGGEDTVLPYPGNILFLVYTPIGAISDTPKRHLVCNVLLVLPNMNHSELVCLGTNAPFVFGDLIKLHDR